MLVRNRPRDCQTNRHCLIRAEAASIEAALGGTSVVPSALGALEVHFCVKTQKFLFYAGVDNKK